MNVARCAGCWCRRCGRRPTSWASWSLWARRAEDINGPLAAFGVPLLVLGGSFFPVSLMPGYLLAAAQFNPVLHMSEALKAVAGRGLGAWSWRRLLADEGGH